MLSAIVQITLGVIIANLYEWIVHKYVLHNMGKKKGSLWSSHWSKHHKESRQNNFFDGDYLQVFSGEYNEGRQEIIGLVILSLIQVPTFYVFPWYAGTTIMMAIAYFAIHRKAHLDPPWAKKWVPWHYEHHMGKNQEANWCITFPLWDYILGTRVKG